MAGGLSLYVVILTHYPNGENSKLLPAIGIAFLAAIADLLVRGDEVLACIVTRDDVPAPQRAQILCLPAALFL